MWGWWCGSGVCGVNVGLVCVCICGWWCGVGLGLALCFVGLVLCGVGDGSGEMGCGVELCCSLAPETLACLH